MGLFWMVESRRRSRRKRRRTSDLVGLAHVQRRIDARAIGHGWSRSFIVVKDYAAGRTALEDDTQWRTHGGEQAGANIWGAWYIHPKRLQPLQRQAEPRRQQHRCPWLGCSARSECKPCSRARAARAARNGHVRACREHRGSTRGGQEGTSDCSCCSPTQSSWCVWRHCAGARSCKGPSCAYEARRSTTSSCG